MRLFLAMPGNEALAAELAARTEAETRAVEYRQFPDGESYVRIHGDVKEGDAVIVCTLAHPDGQFVPLTFAAQAVRAAGSKSLTLVAPYLPYLRQDREFKSGEAVSSMIFADLISREFDRLITVDPHLHRYSSLDELYGIPTTVADMSEPIADWVRTHVESPVILGPDAESAQWVEKIALSAGCPWAVFNKERRGDRDIELTPPALDQYHERTPVLVDDIISSGTTMIGAAKMLAAAGIGPAHCIAVHALFNESTAAELRHVTQLLLTSDSIPNPYSFFQVAPLLAERL